MLKQARQAHLAVGLTCLGKRHGVHADAADAAGSTMRGRLRL